MVGKGSIGERTFEKFNYVFLTFLMLITIYPVIYVVFASVSDSNALISHSGLLVRPLGFNIDAYSAVIKNPNIATGYGVTLFVVA
ncbi:MAG: carbohydrate ABC transporter permease, partial [Clostridium sp.]